MGHGPRVRAAATGYLLIPKLLALADGDAAGARDLAVRALELGRHFDDADLWAFGALRHGRALIALGDAARASLGWTK